MYVCMYVYFSLSLFLSLSSYIYTCKKHSVCIVQIPASIRMHGQHDVCVFEKVSTSNRMHEVARNRAAFHKSKPGSLELVNPLVSTPGRGFTSKYIYIYIYYHTLFKRLISEPINSIRAFSRVSIIAERQLTFRKRPS